MTQTLAILIDAYRELNAKKLFWITLILSGIVIGAFATLSVGANGLSLLSLKIPVHGEMASYWYRDVFSDLVAFWAAWGAVLLAIISTAGIFPDLMSGGSIDLYVSKPIGRVRLYLTKYISGLVFTLLQVSVFASGGFLIFGIRGHEWRPSLFLIVPLVVLVYSYLFAVCVLLGVLTRSTITAILLTIVLWLLFFAVNWAEGRLFAAKVSEDYVAQLFDDPAREDEEQIQQLTSHPSLLNTFGLRTSYLKKDRADAESSAKDANEAAGTIGHWHDVLYMASTFIPKTGETVDLLDRTLFSDKDLEGRSQFDKDFDKQRIGAVFGNSADPNLLEQMETAHDTKLAAEKAARSRSIPWILGTSFAFEAVMVGWAGWIFCRRDY